MIELKKRTRNLIFYIALIILPFCHFLVFWIGVKFNAILLAFQAFDSGVPSWAGGETSWVGFDNFKEVFYSIGHLENWKIAISNSLLLFFWNNILTVPPTLLVAYFVHKKARLGKAFKIVEYAPSMFATIVKVLIYQYFLEEALPYLIEEISGEATMGFISNVATRKPTIWLYGIWIGMGGSLILYVNQMNAISTSITEAAQLDGVTFWQEFWKITMPMCWSLFALQFIISFTGIFGNQFNLLDFYGMEADSELHTVGYYMFTRMLLGGEAGYPLLSAMGLVITAVMLPVILWMRWWSSKVDPMKN